jgi:lysophospholipase L1-like esterase
MPKNAKKTRSKIIFTLSFLIAGALIIELLAFILFKTGVVIRAQRTPWVAFKHPYQPYLGWENPRGTTIGHNCCGKTQSWEIEIDGEGRSVTPHLSSRNPEVEIAILGGSTIFGVCSTGNETTVPSLIEKELWERTGIEVEVHNLAVSGYMSFQELLCLERFTEKHSPHIAIAISGFNDAYYAAMETDWDMGLPIEEITPMVNLIRSIENDEMKILFMGLTRLVERMRRDSYAIDLIGKVGDKLTRRGTTGHNVINEEVVLSRKEIERRAGWTITNYVMMDAMAKQNNIRFFMFLQPTAYTKNHLTGEEESCLAELPKQDLERYIPVGRIFYQTVRLENKSFSFHDISGCLDEISEPVFWDGCHYREVGARNIADAICDVIVPAVVQAAGER